MEDFLILWSMVEFWLFSRGISKDSVHMYAGIIHIYTHIYKHKHTYIYKYIYIF